MRRLPDSYGHWITKRPSSIGSWSGKRDSNPRPSAWEAQEETAQALAIATKVRVVVAGKIRLEEPRRDWRDRLGSVRSRGLSPFGRGPGGVDPPMKAACQGSRAWLRCRCALLGHLSLSPPLRVSETPSLCASEGQGARASSQVWPMPGARPSMARRRSVTSRMPHAPVTAILLHISSSCGVSTIEGKAR